MKLLKFIVVVVGQFCNLKCVNCANMVPLARKEHGRYDLESVISDIKRINTGGV